MVIMSAAIPCSLTPPQRQNLGRFLPEKYRSNNVRDEVLLAHGLLQYALFSQFGKTFPLQYSELGKPSISGYDDIFFSLSHTAGAAVCAVGETPVGVDIERVRPFRHSSIMRLVEAREFEGLDDVGKLCLWVRKESYVKMRGGDISLMKNVRFFPKGNMIPDGIAFEVYRDIDGFVAGACAKTNSLPKTILAVPLEKILEL